MKFFGPSDQTPVNVWPCGLRGRFLAKHASDRGHEVVVHVAQRRDAMAELAARLLEAPQQVAVDAGEDVDAVEERRGHGQVRNAVAGYVSWQITEKMSLHGRAEWATTDTAVFGPISTKANGNPNINKVAALTATLQYDLWKNVISRLEGRYDHLAGSDPVGYGGETGNYTGGASAPGEGVTPSSSSTGSRTSALSPGASTGAFSVRASAVSIRSQAPSTKV